MFYLKPFLLSIKSLFYIDFQPKIDGIKKTELDIDDLKTAYAATFLKSLNNDTSLSLGSESSTPSPRQPLRSDLNDGSDRPPN